MYETQRADMLWVVLINIPYAIMPILLWIRLTIGWRTTGSHEKLS